MMVRVRFRIRIRIGEVVPHLRHGVRWADVPGAVGGGAPVGAPHRRGGGDPGATGRALAQAGVLFFQGHPTREGGKG